MTHLNWIVRRETDQVALMHETFEVDCTERDGSGGTDVRDM